MRRVIWLLAPILAALALAACGGEETPGSQTTAGSPPAAPVEPTATTFPSMLKVTPIAPPLPTTSVDRLLGGTPNRRAAAIVRDQLKAAGLALPGLEVYVLPVSGINEEILVIEIDSTVAEIGGSTAPKDPAPFLKALASVADSEIANVTRVVFNLHSVEAGARNVTTLVFPMNVIAGAAQGQSSDELLKQMQYEVRPEAAP